MKNYEIVIQDKNNNVSFCETVKALCETNALLKAIYDFDLKIKSGDKVLINKL